MNKIKIYIFHTGQVRVDRAIPLHERNPLAVTGFFRSRKKQMVLPVSAYLIVHPKGNILIDTGWDTKYAHERPKQLMGMVDKISAPIIREDEGIDSKLKSVGLSVADIDHVFISHMDFDHASGLRLVRTARDIRTAQEEWDACNKFSLRYQRKGIASAICDALESSSTGKPFITHASISAKPFFQHRGYRVVKEQEVIRQGVALTNFVMEK